MNFTSKVKHNFNKWLIKFDVEVSATLLIILALCLLQILGELLMIQAISGLWDEN